MMTKMEGKEVEAGFLKVRFSNFKMRISTRARGCPVKCDVPFFPNLSRSPKRWITSLRLATKIAPKFHVHLNRCSQEIGRCRETFPFR